MKQILIQMNIPNLLNNNIMQSDSELRSAFSFLTFFLLGVYTQL